MKVNEIINSNLNENWLDSVKGWFNNPPQQPPAAAAPAPAQAVTGKVQNIEPQIDINKLTKILPGPARILTKYATSSGIQGEELVQLLAQSAHETDNFTSMEEQGTKNYFKKYDPKFNPRTAKVLGNVKPGDGERYKGRGPIQLTGRWNYRAAGRALGLPLEQQPELVSKLDIGAKVTLWFWETFVQSKVSNFKDVQAVTKTINPGLNGLQDRQSKFNSLMKAATQ